MDERGGGGPLTGTCTLPRFLPLTARLPRMRRRCPAGAEPRGAREPQAGSGQRAAAGHSQTADVCRRGAAQGGGPAAREPCSPGQAATTGGDLCLPFQAHVMRLCGSLTPPLVALQQQQQATAARLSSSRGRLRTTRAGEGRDGEPDNLKLHVHGSSSASAASGVGIACSPPFCDR